jgi:hypothetical protein
MNGANFHCGKQLCVNLKIALEVVYVFPLRINR